jgi:tRNA modification GTPase
MPRITVLTPAGRGAVASLLLEGLSVLDEPQPLFLAANGRSLAEQPINRICFGRWGSDTPEQIVACRIADDAAELHCHGGDAAVARIVADLSSRGVVCSKSPFAPRKGVNSQSERGPIETACQQALSRASTMRTADILWQQCEGRLAGAIAELESLPAEDAARHAAELLRWADFGLHLTRPWQVVLFGRPNVGKSSLINRLVGFGRSIVFDQPGTTRDVVTVETALEGWPVEFSDTAGLRADADELETEGITRARQRLQSADLRVLLLDVGRPPAEEDQQMLRDWPDALIVAHKCDLPCAWEVLPPWAMEVSSVSGAGVDELAAAIVRRLVPEVPPPMTMLPIDPQQVARIAGYRDGGARRSCSVEL